MAHYIGVVRKDAVSDYSVSFPDIPDVVTAGRGMEEAYAFAAEALAFHIDGMREDGDPIPEPTPREVIQADPENQDAFACIEIPE
jgi:predicted RNase H-like HicB family nuclease